MGSIPPLVLQWLIFEGFVSLVLNIKANESFVRVGILRHHDLAGDQVAISARDSGAVGGNRILRNDLVRSSHHRGAGSLHHVQRWLYLSDHWLDTLGRFRDGLGLGFGGGLPVGLAEPLHCVLYTSVPARLGIFFLQNFAVCARVLPRALLGND